MADLGNLPFKGKVFDTSLAIEVIEHETKEKGVRFINELKRITNLRIILTTPEGFFPLDFGNNHPETHKSGWTKRELEMLGFKCTTFEWMAHKWLLCYCDISKEKTLKC